MTHEKSQIKAFSGDDLSGIGFFFGFLGLFGAMAFGGSWSMGFFVAMIAFVAGVLIGLWVDKRLGAR